MPSRIQTVPRSVPDQVQCAHSPYQDKKKGSEGDMNQDEDWIIDSNPVCGKQEDPCSCLKRDEDCAGKYFAPHHFGKSNRCGDECLKCPVLELLGDEINNQC